jgi:diacylglycerol kinase family enzyme
MKVIILLNKKSGSTAATGSDFTEEKIKEVFNAFSIKNKIIKVGGPDILENIKSQLDNEIDAVVASGGDGTISTAANAVTDTNVPLGILPAGTLNHFAKDLKIPLQLEESVRIISGFKIEKVDTGEVNGKIFINNSSIGFYPKVVKKRIQNQRLGGSKWVAMGSAVINVFKRFPLVEVKVESDTQKIDCRTPFIFIGNNEYLMDLLNLGSRENINKGYLSLYYPNSSGKYSMFKFALLGLFNRLDQQKDFSITLTKEVSLSLNKKIIEVAIDGEVHHLNPPLNYKIKPSSLNVIVP